MLRVKRRDCRVHSLICIGIACSLMGGCGFGMTRAPQDDNAPDRQAGNAVRSEYMTVALFFRYADTHDPIRNLRIDYEFMDTPTGPKIPIVGGGATDKNGLFSPRVLPAGNRVEFEAKHIENGAVSERCSYMFAITVPQAFKTAEESGWQVVDHNRDQAGAKCRIVEYSLAAEPCAP